MDSNDFTGYSSREIFREAMRQEEPADIGMLSAKVGGLSVKGLTRLRNGVITKLVYPMLTAKTLREVADESRELAGKLQALGIAKEAHVVLDELHSDGKSQLVNVKLLCKPMSRYIIRTEAGVDDNEGTAGVSGRLLNIFGGGETFDMNYLRGSKTQAAFQGTFSVPVDADPLKTLSITGVQRMVSNRPYSSHDEMLRSLVFDYQARDILLRSIHNVGYSLSWRNICNLGATASQALRTEAGHSLKSSVTYQATLDTRDSPRLPTSGSLIKVLAEAAGLDGIGDTRFVKSQIQLQTNQDLGGGYLVSTGVQGGLMWNLDRGKRSRLADRFFLGGSTSIRGFEYHGIGPRDGNDSIGGDLYYAAGVSLLTPLPFVTTDSLKGHVWANAGQLALLDARGLLRRSGEIHRFLMSPSAAVGVGIVYNHSVVRAEFSLCLPVIATATDRPKAGPQLGFGITFL
ncbi:hypothetical protein GGI25_003807 [Coemansia spiralis]|uniref:Bacterial surface antigen (D15) domain-containing protein n=1 Tax=Coemansia spiralis TaxID=417178 RepID=A0A9W8KW74_9FUNG|nr:hypothetical protein GGI25_003807 [Coemansia spiralis]